MANESELLVSDLSFQCAQGSAWNLLASCKVETIDSHFKTVAWIQLGLVYLLTNQVTL